MFELCNFLRSKQTNRNTLDFTHKKPTSSVYQRKRSKRMPGKAITVQKLPLFRSLRYFSFISVFFFILDFQFVGLFLFVPFFYQLFNCFLCRFLSLSLSLSLVTLLFFSPLSSVCNSIITYFLILTSNKRKLN